MVYDNVLGRLCCIYICNPALALACLIMITTFRRDLQRGPGESRVIDQCRTLSNRETSAILPGPRSAVYVGIPVDEMGC